MHSSTSNSERRNVKVVAAGRYEYRRGIAIIVTALTLILGAFEVFARVAFHRVSEIEHRIFIDYAEAKSIRISGAGQPPTVLLVGNSLLLAGLDYTDIRRLVYPKLRVVRLAVENTMYGDWQFGIKRLLGEGSKPEFLVLCLNPAQLVASDIRADYSSYYLLEASDILAVKRDFHYDMTQTGDLLFANFSLFYARRNTFRTFLLNYGAVSYSNVMHSLVSGPPVLPASDEMEKITAARLHDIAATVAGHGVKFALLIPPGFLPGEKEVVVAAQKAGTRVLVPVHSGELPPRYFSDGFHLNRAGARIFTQVLADQLTTLAGAQGGSRP